MNQKYRGLYFLGATLGVGLLIVGLMKLMSSSTVLPSSSRQQSVAIASGHKVLENKINELSVDNISPAQYNNLLIEIDNAASQKLFNKAIQDMLLQQLNDKYTELCAARINVLLRADSVKQEEINSLIAHMESTFGTTREIATIKNKVKALNYYTQVLPQKVNALINQGFAEFENREYTQLVNELKNMPNLEGSLKRKKSVISVRNSCISKLQQFYRNYENWNLDMSNIILITSKKLINA
ncbi:hypothetical protein [Sphingobacterium deserti]|uniref:Uncharacterized protein n=1 Tax=Sphingobacterium deserti TaxID=1229276 RepID=A0A0B8T048_9SPHI|nr:hypothetical protein [Sphingobacterium deserti]KGE13506.1 hypothetical protein DI53_2694 [Sphingobacterium deserti]